MRRLRNYPAILCADDYGMSEGVSRGILELGRERRISALSAVTTLPRWSEDAARLAEVRDRLSIGIHINLTTGRPLGNAPTLAPEGHFRPLGKLVADGIRRRLDPIEVRRQIDLQLDAFERSTGFPPDHVDGHQHVHAMPGVRGPLLAALRERYRDTPPLVRDPADKPVRIAMRGGEMAKAMAVAALAAGFGFMARRQGFPVNSGFSGFSAFDANRMYAIELASALRFTAHRHITMCHPGYPDPEIAALDPVVERRGQELETLRSETGLGEGLWRMERPADGPPIDWSAAYPDV